jgi:hypothetical protein
MTRQLSNWITSYLQLVENTEPPQRYHLWTAITTIGAMLSRKCTIELGPETFFPSLYTVLIGPPGVRKGTAIKYMVNEILNHIKGFTMGPSAVTKEQLCVELETAQTQENIDGSILTHSSLFIIAPELIVFMRENDHERLGYLCDLYDGLTHFEYKTKTSGSNYIVNPGLWLLGATTPNWIEIAMKQLGVGGGITSRIIFVYSAKKGKHISITRMPGFDKSLQTALINDMAEIKQLSGKFHITNEADDTFTDWYDGRYKNTRIDDSRFASFWDRLPSMIIKVAMIVSAAKRSTMVVEAQDIVNSVRLLEHILPEMPQAFGGLGYSLLSSQTEAIRNVLREYGSATKSYILHYLRHNLSEWDYHRCRDTLCAEKFCSREFSREHGEEVLVLLKPKQGLELEPNQEDDNDNDD